MFKLNENDKKYNENHSISYGFSPIIDINYKNDMEKTSSIDLILKNMFNPVQENDFLYSSPEIKVKKKNENYDTDDISNITRSNINYISNGNISEIDKKTRICSSKTRKNKENTHDFNRNFMKKHEKTKKNHWTNKEDQILIRLISTSPNNQTNHMNWNRIAEDLNVEVRKTRKILQNTEETIVENRNAKQCRERWSNYLSFQLENKEKDNDWTMNDEKTLYKLVSEIGKKWMDISKIMNNKSASQVKNYYYSNMRKRIRKIRKELILLGFSPIQIGNEKEIYEKVKDKPMNDMSVLNLISELKLELRKEVIERLNQSSLKGESKEMKENHINSEVEIKENSLNNSSYNINQEKNKSLISDISSCKEMINKLKRRFIKRVYIKKITENN